MADYKSSRTLLRERIHGQILRAILDGTLEPGERLRDDELIAWLGTSRAPIREALTQLADLGVVEMSPNRYTKVAQVSPRLYAESAAVWATLVTRGMHWGILAFPADELPLLEELNTELESFDPRDFPPGPTVIDRFVGVILQHCDNTVLLDSIRIHDPLLQLGVNSYKGFMKSEPIHAYFVELIRRCREHDVVEFEAGMREFLAGPMRAFTQEMTGFYGYSDYEGTYGARPEE
jgi:DNA-binding GntR family transcriptional regulator